MSELQETLKKIADDFNRCEIKWLVGGSVLLERLKLHENPHDIDIIIAKNDTQKADTKLSAIGKRKDVPKSDVFVSDFYRKYDIAGTEVDLIAGFKIAHDNGIYEYEPDFEAPEDGIGIRYASLEDWYALYLMMGKAQYKTEKIEHYFNIHGFEQVRLEEILKKELTNKAYKKIKELIK